MKNVYDIKEVPSFLTLLSQYHDNPIICLQVTVVVVTVLLCFCKATSCFRNVSEISSKIVQYNNGSTGFGTVLLVRFGYKRL